MVLLFVDVIIWKRRYMRRWSSVSGICLEKYIFPHKQLKQPVVESLS